MKIFSLDFVEKYIKKYAKAWCFTDVELNKTFLCFQKGDGLNLRIAEFQEDGTIVFSQDHLEYFNLKVEIR